MKKLLLILGRELRMSLRRPSFWVLTLLVPVALAALYALPVIAAQRATGPQTVLVVDETGLFDGGLRSTKEVHFHSMPSLEYAVSHRADGEELVLHIPLKETAMPREATLYYYGSSAPTLATSFNCCCATPFWKMSTVSTPPSAIRWRAVTSVCTRAM